MYKLLHNLQIFHCKPIILNPCCFLPWEHWQCCKQWLNSWPGLEELIKSWNIYLCAKNPVVKIIAVKQNSEAVILMRNWLSLIFWRAWVSYNALKLNMSKQATSTFQVACLPITDFSWEQHHSPRQDPCFLLPYIKSAPKSYCFYLLWSVFFKLS